MWFDEVDGKCQINNGRIRFPKELDLSGIIWYSRSESQFDFDLPELVLAPGCTEKLEFILRKGLGRILKKCKEERTEEDFALLQERINSNALRRIYNYRLDDIIIPPRARHLCKEGQAAFRYNGMSIVVSCVDEEQTDTQ